MKSKHIQIMLLALVLAALVDQGAFVQGLFSSRVTGVADPPRPPPEAPPPRGAPARMEARVGGQTVALTLRHTAVEAEVVGVMSAVRVRHTFVSELTEPVEAVYVFPLPDRAAVHAMTMTLGERVVTAAVRRRAEARQEYESARERGQTAALLEQERANVFTQSVANIRPGDRVEVVLDYVEELVPRDGRYRFVFPMVVGPRYEGGPAHAATPTPTYLPEGTRPGRDVTVALRVRAGVPVRALASPTHRVVVERPGADEARVTLAPADRIPDRDFVVDYELAGARPRATVLASRDARGGHFLFMVQPSAHPRPDDVAPKEYVFVVDTSGSMSGVPIEQVRRAMRRCLRAMRPADRFQIVRFAGDAEALAPAALAPSDRDVERALAFVDTMAAGGGTEFLPALARALGAPADPRRARIVVFMTDGFIGYESDVLRYLHEHRGGANLFAVGVGASVNRMLIDGMARIGHGEPFVILGDDDAAPVIDRLFRTISRPALTHVTLEWQGVEVSDARPWPIPDLFADRPIAVAGRYARGGEGRVTVRGFLAGEPWAETLPVRLPEQPEASPSPALAYLWARRFIGSEMDRFALAAGDERARIEARVTDVALRYHLMSEFTSFVAVDRLVRGPAAQTRVNVPVPLPRGVAEAALGAPGVVHATISQDQFVPGDPEVRVRAPAGTTRVTLVFPDGEAKPCRYDDARGVWAASFLVAEDTPDGVYAIQVILTLDSGAELARTLRYQVDGAAPAVVVEVLPAGPVAPGAEVTLVARPASLRGRGAEAPAAPALDPGDIGDPTFAWRVTRAVTRVDAMGPDGRAVALRATGDGAFRGSLTAPRAPGRYGVAVVARDAARNAARLQTTLVVAGR